MAAVSSVGLLVGAIAGAFFRMSHHAIAVAMSVGAGLLLAGFSLKMAADPIRIAGPVAAALSLLLGAAMFSASNALLARFGAAHRKRCGECIQQPVESQQPGSGVAIAPSSHQLPAVAGTLVGNVANVVGIDALRAAEPVINCLRDRELCLSNQALSMESTPVFAPSARTLGLSFAKLRFNRTPLTAARERATIHVLIQLPTGCECSLAQ